MTTKPYCVWDLETTTHSLNKRKASPFHPDNWIVASGAGYPGEAVAAAWHPTGAWFRELLQSTRLLVGHNIKFDILHACADPENYSAFLDWLASGCNVWDTQLAEYLLEGMDRPSHMCRLEDVAIKYGGDVKLDEVKALWDAGVDTADIDKDLLLRYLVGDSEGHGDIGNTELVFKAQLARAREAGQTKLILLNSGALLCTAVMERAGMHVDLELGLKLAQDLEQELAVLSAELEQNLPDDLPFEFNWGSAAQKSAIIFGGSVKYTGREYLLASGETCLVSEYDEGKHGALTYPQVQEKHYLLADGTTQNIEAYDAAEADGWECMPGKERVQYSGGKKKGEYKTKLVKVDDPVRPKARNCDCHYQFPRLVAPRKEWEGNTEGQWSTASDVIAELEGKGVPFLDTLARVTALTKDLGTYFITTDKEGNKKGMLSLVGPDGIVHHSLNMTSTVTARLSSSAPNLQNIPKGKKSRVKEVFTSRFPGGVIIQSDFSALEIYIQAILTQCKQLIADLVAGLDLHCVRVSQKEGVSYDEALAKCKDPNHPDFKVWDGKRTDAKVFSFQR